MRHALEYDGADDMNLTNVRPGITSYAAALAAGVFLACGFPSATAPDSAESTAHTSSSSSGTTQAPLTSTGATTTPTTGPATMTDAADTSGSTGESTDAIEPCSLVHEGNLYVKATTDLGSLVNIGEVTGDVYIFMRELDQRDLSFLGCLHTAGFMDISDNDFLESTAGLERLTTLEALSISDNPSLQTMVGFEKIVDLSLFEFRDNPKVQQIDLRSLETAKYIGIGFCMNMSGAAGNDSLATLAGFDSLRKVERLVIDGNEALLSADLLDALLANGDPKPLQHSTVRYNPLLPEAETDAKLDALGVLDSEMCGNGGGDPGCICAVG